MSKKYIILELAKLLADDLKMNLTKYQFCY